MLVFCVLLIAPNCVYGAVFNPSYIITDNDLTNYESMTQGDVQSFLEKKVGVLSSYQCKDFEEKERTASEIIWRASQKYRINPMFLLVMLQKEQSLIEDKSPSQKQFDWAMGYAVCDSCSMNDPRIADFKGFGNQVQYTAAINRKYIDKANNSSHNYRSAGNTYNIDDQKVYMTNQATANLYNFTPHIHGNYNFWKIWQRWFLQNYPDGTLLQAEGEPGVWLIEYAKRRPFYTRGALVSRYDPNKIIIVKKDELEKYEIGAPLKFSNYSLLQVPNDDVYLLVDEKLKRIAGKEVLRTLGYNPEEFEPIEYDELEYYELGTEITLESTYPAGALLQNNDSGGVYYVQDGKKYPILAKDILLINYPSYNLTQVSPEELEGYETMNPVKIKDGELVKIADDPRVYVISNGRKWPILDGNVFTKLGYKWDQIRTVSNKSLEIIPDGNFVDLDFKE